jgi:hypothetical protein
VGRSLERDLAAVMLIYVDEGRTAASGEERGRNPLGNRCLKQSRLLCIDIADTGDRPRPLRRWNGVGQFGIIGTTVGDDREPPNQGTNRTINQALAPKGPKAVEPGK